MTHTPRQMPPETDEDRVLSALLDARYGTERGPQIPNHYGNGVHREPKKEKKAA